MTAEQQRQVLTKLLQAKAEAGLRFPMSAGQQGLWHAFRRDPHDTAFNVFLPTRMRATVDLRALQQAIDWVAARHDSLHSVFSDRDGQLSQEVRPGLLPFFEVVELAGMGEDQVREVLAQGVQKPFDLEHGPLLRIHVYRLADDDWIVLALTHHIVVDFWSLILILNELRAAYPAFAQQRVPQLPPAENNFSAFVREQQLLLSGPRGKQLRDYWQAVVTDSTPVIELATDRLRPAVFQNKARSQALDFEAAIVARITALAARTRATPFAVVHAALQVFLSRYSQQKKFLIGSPFVGRSRGAYEQTVGFFINMLPLPANLEGDPTFTRLIGRTSQNLFEAMEHEAYPIAQIVHDARQPRDPSRSPLFQVSCTFEKAQVKHESGRASFLFPNQKLVWDFGGLPQESFYLAHPTCHYDLEFIFEMADDKLRGLMVGCAALFDAETLTVMAANFASLFSTLVEQPDVPLSHVVWPTASKTTAKNTTATLPTAQRPNTLTVHGMIATAAGQWPQQTALQYQAKHLSYAELRQVTRRMARELHQRSPALRERTGEDSPCSSRLAIVPIATASGPLAVMAMLAVHQAGAVSAAIDVTQPAIDLRRLCDDTGAKVCLADRRDNATEEDVKNVERVTRQLDSESRATIEASESRATIEDVDWIDLAELVHYCSAAAGSTPAIDIAGEHQALPGDVAYLVYTSGSTGRPKGVLVEHAAVCNTLQWRQQAVPLRPDDRVLMLLSHQFDAALGIAWSTLTQGATLVWPDDEAARDPQQLLEFVQREWITVLPAVPSLLRILIAHPLFSQCHSLRLIFTGGEAMSPELPSQLRQVTQAEFWNFYGPSEAAIEATACQVTQHSQHRPVPIGRPILNTDVLVLDELHHPLPDTLPGELAIAGAGLARGYLNDPALTHQRFLIQPVDGATTERGASSIGTAVDQPATANAGQRVYLTGDRGRRLPNGMIEFLGRSDHQIKLRGYRIELGEIESILESHPNVARAAVKLIAANNPQAQLIGYVSLHNRSHINSVDELSADRGVQGPGDALSSGAAAIRRHASEHLASYKVPSAIIVLSELPLTSSGKVDRQRLPEASAVPPEPQRYIAPHTALEVFLATAWCEALQVERVSIDCNFFDAGGSSLQAAMLTTRLSQDLGVHVPTALLFDLVDISHLAMRLAQLHRDALAVRFGENCLAQQLARIEELSASGVGNSVAGAEEVGEPASGVLSGFPGTLHPLLALLKVNGSKLPIFMVHPPGGIVVCYRELARQLDIEQPLIAIRARGLHGEELLPPTLAAMAADYVQAIRSYQPHGPYRLGGWSLGGLVAYEMAQQLLKDGELVEPLLLLDTTIPETATQLVPAEELVNVGLEYGIELTLDELGELPAEEQLAFLWEHARGLGVLDDTTPAEVVARVLEDLQQLFHHHLSLAKAYRIEPLAGRILLIRPRETPVAQPIALDRGWRHLVQGVEVKFTPGHHHSMVQLPHVEQLAQLL